MAHTTRRSDPRAAKVRDITRSVLPSTVRHTARAELTGVRRHHRRDIAGVVRRIPTLPCTCTVDPDAGGGWWGWLPQEERRAGLGELAGWALDAGHHRLLNDICRHHARRPGSCDPPAVRSRWQQLGDGRSWRPLRHRGDVEAWAGHLGPLESGAWILENLLRERERGRRPTGGAA